MFSNAQFAFLGTKKEKYHHKKDVSKRVCALCTILNMLRKFDKP